MKQTPEPIQKESPVFWFLVGLFISILGFSLILNEFDLWQYLVTRIFSFTLLLVIGLVLTYISYKEGSNQ